MKNIKNTIVTIALVGTIGIGTAFAQSTTSVQKRGGILVGDLAGTNNQPQQCTETTTKDNTNWGILLSEFASSLFGNIGVGFAADAPDKEENVQVNCGILLSE